MAAALSITLSGMSLVFAEDALDENSLDDYLANPDQYIPVDMMSMPTSGGGIALGWRNPECETITKISLYDVTEEPVLLSESFSESLVSSSAFISEMPLQSSASSSFSAAILRSPIFLIYSAV